MNMNFKKESLPYRALIIFDCVTRMVKSNSVYKQCDGFPASESVHISSLFYNLGTLPFLLLCIFTYLWISGLQPRHNRTLHSLQCCLFSRLQRMEPLPHPQSALGIMFERANTDTSSMYSRQICLQSPHACILCAQIHR